MNNATKNKLISITIETLKHYHKCKYKSGMVAVIERAERRGIAETIELKPVGGTIWKN